MSPPMPSDSGALDNQQNPYAGFVHPFCLRPIPSNCHSSRIMDLLPQEIIDKIIDNLPRSSLRSASLVAKRWRTRSQQRALDIIWFRSEDTMNRWLDIQSSPGGISSYLPFVGFSIIEWTDPTLFGRVLRIFNSLTTLAISGAGISDEMLEYMLHEELSRITTLHLRSLRCSLSTVMFTILAFPNLRDLFIVDPTIMSREEPSTRSVLSPKRPLDSLLVRGRGNGTVAEALTDYRLMSRRLTLDAQHQNIQKLLTFSSVTIVDLVLIGMYSSCSRPRKRK